LPHVINSVSRGFPAGMKAVAQNLPQVLTGLILIMVVLYLPHGILQLWSMLKTKTGQKASMTGGGSGGSV